MSSDAKISATDVTALPVDDSHSSKTESVEVKADGNQEKDDTGLVASEWLHGIPIINTGDDVSRHLVSVRDDGDPSFTFRSVVLGTIFTTLSCVISMIYEFKPVDVGVSGIFLQLLVFIFGEAWAIVTPAPERFKSPWAQRTLRFLNSGQHFGLKEHVVATLIASSGGNGEAGVEIFAVERLFYDKASKASTAVLSIFSISLCGFVLAGILRPLIVYPAEMVYWGNLPQIALFQSMHFDPGANRRRLKMFGWALLIALVWEIFPAYMVTWFGGISVICLASMNAPKNTRTILSNIFGGSTTNEGLGLLNISLDWQYIGSGYLSLPLKQQLNMWIGFAVAYLVVPCLYYGNVWHGKNYPFMSSALFKSDGTKFDVTSVINDRNTIDYQKLRQVGLPHITSGTVWAYMCHNAAIGALISQVLIFYRKDMVLAWKQARNRTQPDPHYQAMLKYKEVPMWWYLAVFALCFFAGLIVNVRGDTTLSAGAYVLALAFGAFIAPFSCILFGLNGTGISTNQISKMLAGVVQPGRPLAGLFFASWSHQVIALAVNLASWLKVGQYMKVPPRVMFMTQIYATIVGNVLNYVVMIVIVESKKAILQDPIGSYTWSGAAFQSLNTQAITWALAKDVYGRAGEYIIVPLGLLFGLALPMIHWAVIKMFPRVGKMPLNTTFMCHYAGSLYYGITSWIMSTIVVGALSQIWLRKRHPNVFNKYNYLIGAALDGGSQIMIFVLSFAVFGASGKERPFPTWWGNPSSPVNPDHCI